MVSITIEVLPERMNIRGGPLFEVVWLARCQLRPAVRSRGWERESRGKREEAGIGIAQLELLSRDRVIGLAGVLARLQQIQTEGRGEPLHCLDCHQPAWASEVAGLLLAVGKRSLHRLGTQILLGRRG